MVAMCQIGSKHFGEGDYDKAVEYFTKAAELGDADAHNELGNMYCEGEGVEKDEDKGVYHLKKAAIGGHPIARHNLGCEEWGNDRLHTAAKHFIIAASLGFYDSLTILTDFYEDKFVSKEDYDAAVRAYHAAVDATKSSERAEAEAHDTTLFTLPKSSHLGDCSICCLTLPIDEYKHWTMSCCCKIICKGCYHANHKHEEEENLEHRCPFCREPVAKLEEEVDKIIMKRVKADDPIAIIAMGNKSCHEGDYDAAFEHYKKAAELGDVDAHYNYLPCIGRGLELRKTRKSEFIIWNRQQLAVIRHQGTFLDVESGTTAGLREQRNIGSSLLTSDIMIH